MSVDISDKAQALLTILKEFEHVEQEQVKVGEDMAILLYQQVRLSEKSRALKEAMEKLTHNF